MTDEHTSSVLKGSTIRLRGERREKKRGEGREREDREGEKKGGQIQGDG